MAGYLVDDLKRAALNQFDTQSGLDLIDDRTDEPRNTEPLHRRKQPRSSWACGLSGVQRRSDVRTRKNGLRDSLALMSCTHTPCWLTTAGWVRDVLARGLLVLGCASTWYTAMVTQLKLLVSAHARSNAGARSFCDARIRFAPISRANPRVIPFMGPAFLQETQGQLAALELMISRADEYQEGGFISFLLQRN